MHAIGSSLEKYLAEIARYPRVSAEREAALSLIIQTNRSERRRDAALEELVQANLLIVVHCLKHFGSHAAVLDGRISRMDLVAEGNVALMKSARRYDCRFRSEDYTGSDPVRFAAYAFKSVKCAMRRAIKRSHLIHIPEYHYAYWSEMTALCEMHGVEMDDERLHRELDISPEVLDMIKAGREISICHLEELGNTDEESGWEDFMPDHKALCPARETGGRDLLRFLIGEIQELPPRTAEILQLMFLSEHRPSLAEMAKPFGISAERCRQIGAQGLRKLREQIVNRADKVDPSLVAMPNEVAA